MQRLKNALSTDEAARKEAAASREKSGGVPDVGLASILKNKSMSQTTHNIDIASKIVHSDKKTLESVDQDISMDISVDGREFLATEHKIRSKGPVTEMNEESSGNEDFNGKYIPFITI